MKGEMTREEGLELELKRAAWSLTAAISALADVVEVRGIDALESHAGGIMVDQIIYGCIDNLRALAERLDAVAGGDGR